MVETVALACELEGVFVSCEVVIALYLYVVIVCFVCPVVALCGLARSSVNIALAAARITEMIVDLIAFLPDILITPLIYIVLCFSVVTILYHS